MSSILNSNYNYDYFRRMIYSSNRLARKEETRASLDKKSLMLADTSAIQKISKQLRELEYDTDHGTGLYNGVKLYVETYNNLIESASSSDDSNIATLKKQITNLTKQEKDNLESIGITISGSGKLKLDKNTFAKTEPYKIAKVFSSSSTFSKSIQSYASRLRSKAQKLPVYTSAARKVSPDTEAGSGQTVDISL